MVAPPKVDCCKSELEKEPGRCPFLDLKVDRVAHRMSHQEALSMAAES